jgi:hypothetical protein
MKSIEEMVRKARERYEHLVEKKLNGKWLPREEFEEVKRLQFEQPEWKFLREKVGFRCGNICERCKSKPYQECHHLTYDRRFREKMEDLLGVCTPCHRELTRLQREGKIQPVLNPIASHIEKKMTKKNVEKDRTGSHQTFIDDICSIINEAKIFINALGVEKKIYSTADHKKDTRSRTLSIVTDMGFSRLLSKDEKIGLQTIEGHSLTKKEAADTDKKAKGKKQRQGDYDVTNLHIINDRDKEQKAKAYDAFEELGNLPKKLRVPKESPFVRKLKEEESFDLNLEVMLDDSGNLKGDYRYYHPNFWTIHNKHLALDVEEIKLVEENLEIKDKDYRKTIALHRKKMERKKLIIASIKVEIETPVIKLPEQRSALKTQPVFDFDCPVVKDVTTKVKPNYKVEAWKILEKHQLERTVSNIEKIVGYLNDDIDISAMDKPMLELFLV